MKKLFLIGLCGLLGVALGSAAALALEKPGVKKQKRSHSTPSSRRIELNHAARLIKFCLGDLRDLPMKTDFDNLSQACAKVEQLKGCHSRSGLPIVHYEREGTFSRGQRILALGAMHGDEVYSASMTRSWMERLVEINPRNTWRIVPIVNPDGLRKNTRENLKGVDLNRNFPTRDWEESAKRYWQVVAKGSKRRYPGNFAGSEPETRCIIKQIKDFQPDLIVAIHTPLGVLDYDGPRLNFPQQSPLPWIKLGNYPGSLGRYMWYDHGKPVLNIELRGNNKFSLAKLDQLQDVSGMLAILTREKKTNQ